MALNSNNNDKIIEMFTDEKNTIQKNIIDQIDKSVNSIKMTIYELTDPEITNALIHAKKRGVNISIIADRGLVLKDNSLLKSLYDNGIKDIHIDYTRGTMHNKVLIIDDTNVITGSYNFTKNAQRNRENMTLILDEQDTVSKYNKEFNKIVKESVIYDTFKDNPGNYKVEYGYDNKYPTVNKYTEGKITKNNIQLNKTPIYVPYQDYYGRVRTKDGTEESSPVQRRYYSSIDAELYFGNHYVEDICTINYNINQSSLPIFGFNSYTADEVALGSRIISGEFGIRFTSPNYLFKLLEAAQSARNAPIVDTTHFIPAKKRRNYLLSKGIEDTSVIAAISKDNRTPLWKETFDIDIVYGSVHENGEPVHIMLKDVNILSCRNGADVNNPFPLTEIYTFVARDIATKHEGKDKKLNQAKDPNKR